MSETFRFLSSLYNGPHEKKEVKKSLIMVGRLKAISIRHVSHSSISHCTIYTTIIRVKPLLSRHLRDPSVRLIEAVKINNRRLICTVIKLHVVKETIQSSSSSPFIANFNLFVNAKTLTDLSPYFKDVIQYYYCQFSPVSA